MERHILVPPLKQSLEILLLLDVSDEVVERGVEGLRVSNRICAVEARGVAERVADLKQN